MIQAVIYDMDGVIIDSEPLWREAIISTFKDIGLAFNEEMCRITQGMRLYEVVEYWYARTPWEGPSVKEVEAALLKKVTELIIEKGVEMKGVAASIDFFRSKGFKIALASSSALSLIETVLEKLDIKNEFEVVNSAEHLNYGKPHPEIFLKTANQLNVKPINCLVIEDSFHGVLAGKAAVMKVIAVPETENLGNPKFSIADYQVNDLTEIEQLTFE
jgi:sugar-phosphatase